MKQVHDSSGVESEDDVIGSVLQFKIRKNMPTRSISEVIFHLNGGLTLKNRRRYCTVYSLAARKNTSRKKRLIKRTRQNRPVPAWVIIRTHRHVRTNPKRRLWRRTDVNVG